MPFRCRPFQASSLLILAAKDFLDAHRHFPAQANTCLYYQLQTTLRLTFALVGKLNLFMSVYQIINFCRFRCDKRLCMSFACIRTQHNRTPFCFMPHNSDSTRTDICKTYLKRFRTNPGWGILWFFENRSQRQVERRSWRRHSNQRNVWSFCTHLYLQEPSSKTKTKGRRRK